MELSDFNDHSHTLSRVNVRGNEIPYSNQYGTLTLMLIADIVPINTLQHTATNSGSLINMQDCERVSLITEGRNIQIVFCGQNAYIIYHETADTGALAIVRNMEYTGNADSEQEINRLVNEQDDPIGNRLLNWYTL